MFQNIRFVLPTNLNSYSLDLQDECYLFNLLCFYFRSNANKNFEGILYFICYKFV
jgi:hypothetical protein